MFWHYSGYNLVIIDCDKVTKIAESQLVGIFWFKLNLKPILFCLVTMTGTANVLLTRNRKVTSQHQLAANVIAQDAPFSTMRGYNRGISEDR